MNAKEIKALIKEGALKKYENLYRDVEKQSERFIAAIDAFEKKYGTCRDIAVFSVPGRSEIVGNHTDHNLGKVLAGAVDRDIIAVAAKTEAPKIRFLSEGYPEDKIDIAKTQNPENFKKYTSASLIAGVVRAFSDRGISVGGFDVYATSEVFAGSGISSSAAYEVMVANILNQLYAGGKFENPELAKIAQYAENEYFGKPCGLMDQMACAVGGFVYIDFKNSAKPIVNPIDFSLTDAGYSLCIINTGGNHADLNEDYASVPSEMKSVAKLLGRENLRGLKESDILKNIKNIRRLVGDRAVLRALHFFRENDRVENAKDALVNKDAEKFLSIVSESGRSSFEYLQNVYTVKNVKEQGLSMALALADGYLKDKGGAMRVHGGGFAGTIQVFVKNEDADGFVSYMERIFGEGAVMALRIRPVGACKLF